MVWVLVRQVILALPVPLVIIVQQAHQHILPAVLVAIVHLGLAHVLAVDLERIAPHLHQAHVQVVLVDIMVQVMEILQVLVMAVAREVFIVLLVVLVVRKIDVLLARNQTHIPTLLLTVHLVHQGLIILIT